VKGTTPPEEVEAPLKAGGLLAAVGLGVTVVLAGFKTLIYVNL
jgi:hypothetical protein